VHFSVALDPNYVAQLLRVMWGVNSTFDAVCELVFTEAVESTPTGKDCMKECELLCS
jgi:hypothetical protein